MDKNELFVSGLQEKKIRVLENLHGLIKNGECKHKFLLLCTSTWYEYVILERNINV
jgi:hypothetical protein